MLARSLAAAEILFFAGCPRLRTLIFQMSLRIQLYSLFFFTPTNFCVFVLQFPTSVHMQTHKVEEEVGTLLYYASKGNFQIIKHMLDNGTAVDAADYDGRTALHLAASEGHVAAVKLLLSYNANVNPPDRYNDTVSLVPPPPVHFI
jgi:hypothetical protein